jgi:hypothetical protein
MSAQLPAIHCLRVKKWPNSRPEREISHSRAPHTADHDGSQNRPCFARVSRLPSHSALFPQAKRPKDADSVRFPEADKYFAHRRAEGQRHRRADPKEHAQRATCERSEPNPGSRNGWKGAPKRAEPKVRLFLCYCASKFF